MRECPKCHKMSFVFDPYFQAECCTSLQCAYQADSNAKVERTEGSGVRLVLSQSRFAARRLGSSTRGVHSHPTWAR